jgi:hypothetical protein
MQNNFITSQYLLKPLTWGILHDAPWENFGENNLPEYINDGYQILQKRLESFKDLNRKLTAFEEHELEFMLASLIHAKNVLFQENNSK